MYPIDINIIIACRLLEHAIFLSSDFYELCFLLEFLVHHSLSKKLLSAAFVSVLAFLFVLI